MLTAATPRIQATNGELSVGLKGLGFRHFSPEVSPKLRANGGRPPALNHGSHEGELLMGFKHLGFRHFNLKHDRNRMLTEAAP